MKYPEINDPIEKALELEQFREMDYYAVNNYYLPIEMMMENAGLQLANLVAGFTEKTQSIKIGIGNGNLEYPMQFIQNLERSNHLFTKAIF